MLADRERAEVELSDAAGARETAVGALYRLQGAGERLAVRAESASGLGARIRDDLVEAERARGARTDEAPPRARAGSPRGRWRGARYGCR